MQPTPDFDASRLARSLLRRSRQGALATLMAGSGDPYCSLVNVASHADASPILLISRLALHTRNLLADSRVSLMLDERAAGDPLEGARIMLAGRAEGATGEAANILRRRYLNARSTLRTLMELVRHGRLDLSKLITHRFPLAQIEEAYELFSNQRDGVVPEEHDAQPA